MILSITFAAAAAMASGKLPAPGEPRISERTQASGGTRDPDQLALTFESADLQLEVLPDTRELKGTASLVFTAKAPLKRLLVDLDANLGPDLVQIEGVTLPRSAFDNSDGQLVIKLPKALSAGQRVTVEIAYGGTPHIAAKPPWDSGVVWSKTPDGQPWFATTTQGAGCDLFWPCLDFPGGEPGRVTLHITAPKGLKAPSNGVLLGVDQLSDGRTTWNWTVKSPNPYGVAVNVGPYEEISSVYHSRFGNQIPMHFWHLPRADDKPQQLFAEFAPAIDFFERVIGPYPFGDEKIGVVEVPYRGMEHQTINGYGFDYRKMPEGFDALFVHEFGHEYFGNQLTASDWDDFWLHEGYGSYVRPLYGQWREGRALYDTILNEQRNEIISKDPMVSGASRPIAELMTKGLGSDTYVKGSWILHTLRGLIGDAAFWEVTRRAVYGRPDPKPGNFQPRFSSTREYEAIVREVTGHDYGWFFNVYLREGPLPELVQIREAAELKLQWKTPRDLPFPMPVEVQVDGRIVQLAMASGEDRLAVPAGAHLVVDPNARVLKRSQTVEALQAWSAMQSKSHGSKSQ